MKVTKLLVSASVTGIVVAGLIVSPVLACHPQGQIIKTVQDNTKNSVAIDANDAAHALGVNSGDTLTYTVAVSNAETQEGSHNEADMTNVVLTDVLPDGVQLISNPSQRTINENLGTIAANGIVTKQYQVKVTSTEDNQVLTNKACFTSSSNLGKSYDQSKCDVAIVTVHVPTSVPQPTPKPMMPQTTTPSATTPTSLPNTGAGNIIVPAVIVSLLGYAGYLLHLKRHNT